MLVEGAKRIFNSFLFDTRRVSFGLAPTADHQGLTAAVPSELETAKKTSRSVSNLTGALCVG